MTFFFCRLYISKLDVVTQILLPVLRRWTREKGWQAGLAYLVSSRPARMSVSKRRKEKKRREKKRKGRKRKRKGKKGKEKERKGKKGVAFRGTDEVVL